jgi:predicted TPR repeat methyltransferase
MSFSSNILENYHQARKCLADGDIAKAAEFCKHILATDPAWPYGYYLMSRLFKATGDLDRALTFADMAVKQAPDIVEFYIWTAELLFHKKEYSAAERMSRQALAKKPDDQHALGQLFAALSEQGRVAESHEVMLQIAKLQSHDPKAAHLESVLSGVTMETAPAKFVETLFDGYAEFFDQHLEDGLSYRVPTLAGEVIRALPQIAGKANLSLLDLGCGTGLAAVALRDITSLRIGVDLSQSMLDQAQAKQLYAELHKADIADFVLKEARSYDLAVALDVLVYLGDLTPLFTAVKRVLTNGGLFGFSIEREENTETFRLNATGRYSHNISYITTLAQQCGYEVLLKNECIGRMEKGQPVQSVIIVLKALPT